MRLFWLYIIIVGNLWAAETTPFSKTKVKLAGHTIRVEVADTDELRQQGFMFRKRVPEGTGMLFIFSSEQPLSFWMKNTLVPLSIAYLDESLKIIDIQDMEPASPMDLYPRAYPSLRPAKYALEVPRGWYKKNKIKVGDKLDLPKDLSSAPAQSQ